MSDIHAHPKVGTTGSFLVATVMSDSRVPLVEQDISVLDGVW